MAFREVQPDVIQDTTTGRMMKVDRDTVTQMRNNGQILPEVGSGLRTGAMAPHQPALKGVPTEYGGAGMPPQSPAPNAPQDDLQILGVPSSPTPTRSPSLPALRGIPQEYGGAAPQAQPGGGRVPLRGNQASGPRLQANGLPEGLIMQRIAPTKGGMVPHSESVAGIRPEQQDATIETLREGVRLEAEANNELSRVKAEGARAESEFYAKRAEEFALERDEIKHNAEQRDIWTQQEIAALDNDIDIAAKEKPSGTYFGDGDAVGVAGGLLGIIGIALGQYQSGMTGGPNAAMQMMDTAIKQRMQNQKDQIKERLQTAQGKRSELSRAQIYGAENDQALLEAVVTKEYTNSLQAILADADMKAAHPMAQAMLGQLQQRLGEKMLPVYQSIQSEATRKYVHGSPGGVRIAVDPMKVAEGELAKIQKTINDANQTLPSGQGAVYGGAGKVVGALDSTAARELNSEAISSIKLVKLLNKVEELQAKGTGISPKDRGLLESLDVIGTLKLAQSLSFRVGTEQDFERASAAIGSGNWDYLTDKNAFKASQMKKMAIEGISDSYGFYGFDSSQILEEMNNTARLGE